MKTIYWTERYERIWNVELWVISQNWIYTASFYLNWQFQDWYNAWLTNIIDQEIPEENYTWFIVPWIPKLTRFCKCEYNENYVNAIELQRSLENVWARFNIDIFETIEEARQWVRDNTSLVEESEWVFIISEEWEFMGQVVPRKTLVIN